MDNWYFNRLSTMSIAEVLFQIEAINKGALWKRNSDISKFLIQNRFDSKSNILGINAMDLNPVPDSFKIFGIDFKVGKPFEINWNKDIYQVKHFHHYYRKINIRSNPNLSAKCVWEINRLQFLTGLCMNYKVTNDRSDLDLFMQINKSWSSQNPYLEGCKLV